MMTTSCHHLIDIFIALFVIKAAPTVAIFVDYLVFYVFLLFEGVVLLLLLLRMHHWLGVSPLIILLVLFTEKDIVCCP
jgi:hypothetical protein